MLRVFMGSTIDQGSKAIRRKILADKFYQEPSRWTNLSDQLRLLKGNLFGLMYSTQPPARFHRNPLGRGQLAVFPSGGRRTRFSRIDSDMLVARVLKNSQLIRPRPGETQGIWETVH